MKDSRHSSGRNVMLPEVRVSEANLAVLRDPGADEAAAVGPPCAPRRPPTG